MKRHAKSDFPVSKVRRYLEPGPIVLVSSHWQGKHNIMTLGWHTVLEFSPSLVGCMHFGRQSQLRYDPQEPRMRDQSAHDKSDGHRCEDRQHDRCEHRQVQRVWPDSRAGSSGRGAAYCRVPCELRMSPIRDAHVDKYNFFIFEVV